MAGATEPAHVPVRPFHDETYVSFMNRLAGANHLRDGHKMSELVRRAGQPSPLDGVAAFLACDARDVALAMPTVPRRFTDERVVGRPRLLRRPACPRCAARRAGHAVQVYAQPWHTICHRHHLWLGHHGEAPFDMSGLGRHYRAVAEHRDLVFCVGPSRAHRAFSDATDVMSTYLLTGVRLRAHTMRAAEALRTQRFPSRWPLRPVHEYAAVYPEAVRLAALIVDWPYGGVWEKLNSPLAAQAKDRVAAITGGHAPTGPSDVFFRVMLNAYDRERDDSAWYVPG